MFGVWLRAAALLDRSKGHWCPEHKPLCTASYTGALLENLSSGPTPHQEGLVAGTAATVTEKFDPIIKEVFLGSPLNSKVELNLTSTTLSLMPPGESLSPSEIVDAVTVTGHPSSSATLTSGSLVNVKSRKAMQSHTASGSKRKLSKDVKTVMLDKKIKFVDCIVLNTLILFLLLINSDMIRRPEGFRSV
ncbi:hypothetical protein ACOSQ3_022089 [Xanthoceras sorbifolium]